MSSDRIDFSPLDPKRDPERFERMVRNVLSGVQSAPAPAPLLLDFLRWGRLGLVAAALIALGAWLLTGHHLGATFTCARSGAPQTCAPGGSVAAARPPACLNSAAI